MRHNPNILELKISSRCFRATYMPSRVLRVAQSVIIWLLTVFGSPGLSVLWKSGAWCYEAPQALHDPNYSIIHNFPGRALPWAEFQCLKTLGTELLLIVWDNETFCSLGFWFPGISFVLYGHNLSSKSIWDLFNSNFASRRLHSYL